MTSKRIRGKRVMVQPGLNPARSLTCQGFDASAYDKTLSGFEDGRPKILAFSTPLSDIDLMIENGWGDTPQNKLPADWRTTHK